jgi:hypothetical protein
MIHQLTTEPLNIGPKKLNTVHAHPVTLACENPDCQQM